MMDLSTATGGHLNIITATSQAEVTLVPGHLFQNGDESCVFPVDSNLPLTSEPFMSSRLVAHTDPAQILTAYALLLRYYVGSSTVVFGLSNEDENTTAVVRLVIDRDMKIADLVADFQKMLADFANMAPDGIEMIDESSTSSFNTTVCLRKLKSDDRSSSQSDTAGFKRHKQSAVCLSIFTNGGGPDFKTDSKENFRVEFDATQISKAHAVDFISSLTQVIIETAVSQVEPPSNKARDFNKLMYSSSQMQTFRERASKMPSTTTICLHNLVSNSAERYPDATALASTAGNLSYNDLESKSTAFALQLISYGVVPGEIVPVCVEKSIWAIVVMLGILKAGAAFAMLDPDYPRERLEEAADRLKAKTFVCSSKTPELSLPGISNLIDISRGFGHSTPDFGMRALDPSAGNPSALAYVVFTSGSTGKPKIVKIGHSCIATSIIEHGPRVCFSTSTHFLQFTSFTFDPFILEIFSTLAFGGCVCVPTDDERMNECASFMKKMDVNHVTWTPSFARLIDPEDVPGLKTLMLGGESLTTDNIRTWADKVTLVQPYGPAECSILCTIKTMGVEDHPQCFGTAVGSVIWIANVDDETLLVPDGTVGELCIQGPIVGHGYFEDQEKTSQSFIEGLQWLPKQASDVNDKPHKVYKTGDLACFQADGSLNFLGRKDFQVKIRGQRVELGEIEFQVLDAIDFFSEVIIDLIVLRGENRGTDQLAAFVVCRKELYAKDMLLPHLEDIRERVKQRLPQHMCPWIYIPFEQIPVLPSRKVDRGKLKAMAAALGASDIARYMGATQPIRKLETAEEKFLQQVWATALDIELSQIGGNDEFFTLGGNSIKAMQLVAEAHHAGYQLTVQEVFENAKLAEMAMVMKPYEIQGSDFPRPFALMEIKSQALRMACEQCGLNEPDIEDIYPTTPEQDRMVRETTLKPGTHHYTMTWKLEPDVNVVRFRQAWQIAAESMPILRTRIIEVLDPCEGQKKAAGCLQVLVKEDLEWSELPVKRKNETRAQKFGDDLCLAQKECPGYPFGKRLGSYVLFEDLSGSRFFQMNIHHATFDGWSMSLVWEVVRHAYLKGQQTDNIIPFNSFVKYAAGLSHEVTDAFWVSNLAGTPAQRVIDPVPQGYIPYQTTRFDVRRDIDWPSSTITSSTLIHAGYSIALSKFENLQDVVYRSTGTGRNVPLRSILRIAGPTMNSFPVRVIINNDDSIQDFLSTLQRDFLRRVHEYRGLENIRNASQDAKVACSFDSSYLIVQPDAQWNDENFPGMTKVTAQWQPSCTPLSVCAIPKVYGMRLFVSFDENLVPKERVDGLIGNMVNAIQSMAASMRVDGRNMKVSELLLGK